MRACPSWPLALRAIGVPVGNVNVSHGNQTPRKIFKCEDYKKLQTLDHKLVVHLGWSFAHRYRFNTSLRYTVVYCC